MESIVPTSCISKAQSGLQFQACGHMQRERVRKSLHEQGVTKSIRSQAENKILGYCIDGIRTLSEYHCCFSLPSKRPLGLPGNRSFLCSDATNIPPRTYLAIQARVSTAVSRT